LGIHEAIMLTTTSLAVALCIFAFLVRKNFATQLRKIMLLGLFILGVLLVIGTDRGAQLVYGYGTAVNWSTAQQQK
jgi:high-affinity Fe2+/Pb2+ permease